MKNQEKFINYLTYEFTNSRSGLERKNIILDLQKRGFTDVADTLITQWVSERDAFLEENNVDEIRRTFDNREYFLIVEENGNPGEEGYSVDTKKMFIPDHLDIQWMK